MQICTVHSPEQNDCDDDMMVVHDLFKLCHQMKGSCSLHCAALGCRNLFEKTRLHSAPAPLLVEIKVDIN